MTAATATSLLAALLGLLALIVATLVEIERLDVDWRHIEALLRRNCGGTLDHLSPSEWRDEVALAVACRDAMGPHDGERLARSYGL